jgi:glycosyltransferase involved in cell wall biosynthesis
VDREVPKLSVILPCRNGGAFFEEQLEALAAQRWHEPWELIVVDNGSTDETRKTVERFSDRIPDVRVVDASDRTGSALARNRGVEAARADAIAFCDADDRVGEGWVAAIGTALQQHDVVVCRQDHEALNPPWVLATRDRIFQDDVARTWYPPHLAHGSTCGLGVRRSLHERIGGFDESLRFGSDTDYCFRLQLHGARLEFVPDAVVHYRFRASLAAIFRQASAYAEATALLQSRYAVPARHVPLWRWPLKHWRPVIATVFRVHRRAGRARLAWLLGWQLGRFRGSVKYRVLAL